MIRVTTWRQNAPPPPGTAPAAGLAAFREFVEAVKKVPGTSDVQWGFGHGGLVTVGSATSYAVADAILKDPRVQAAGAKLLALGMGIAEDYFVLDQQQAMPFIPQ